MTTGRVQAKDISDEQMFRALEVTRGINGASDWSSLWNVQQALPDFPAKVVLAKLASMVRRGVLKGCACGCRGDFELPNEEEKP